MSNTFYTQYVSMQYFVFMINKKLGREEIE
ncbi:Uncharacterised protein [Streptococcus pneumoniae]|nr:Uncharacterised protein [Streptococcus pneumoniae]